MFDIRILRSVGLLLAILSLVLVIGLRTAPDSQGGQEPQAYIVQPGDSLSEVISGADPRETVGGIKELNHLQGSTIQAGQTLLLPVS
jgi:LysM repeat protein